MRRHGEQVFYSGEGKYNIRWHALYRRDYRTLSSGRDFTKYLLPLTKYTSRKEEEILARKGRNFSEVLREMAGNLKS